MGTIDSLCRNQSLHKNPLLSNVFVNVDIFNMQNICEPL